jgi:hypothetical protein
LSGFAEANATIGVMVGWPTIIQMAHRTPAGLMPGIPASLACLAARSCDLALPSSLPVGAVFNTDGERF